MNLPGLASPALGLSEVATPISPNFCSSHPRTLMRLGVCFAAMAATATAQGNVSFAWATVDNPGNADDLADGNACLEGVRNFGGVNSTNRIATLPEPPQSFAPPKFMSHASDAALFPTN